MFHLPKCNVYFSFDKDTRSLNREVFIDRLNLGFIIVRKFPLQIHENVSIDLLKLEQKAIVTIRGMNDNQFRFQYMVGNLFFSERGELAVGGDTDHQSMEWKGCQNLC